METNKHPREILNAQAKSMMRLGRFVDAKNELLLAYEFMGPHVELLIDLAGCYFRIGDFKNFEKWTNFANEEYTNNKNSLSVKMDTIVRMKISRCLIELGHISKALPLLECDELPFGDDEMLMTFERIHCQLMFIYCIQSDLNKISQQYKVLEQFRERKLFSEVEIQCALMHGDHAIIGHQSASKRVEHLLKNFNLDQNRKNLVIYDHLFLIMHGKHESEFKASLLENVDYKSADQFEKLVHDLYLVRMGKAPFEKIELIRTEGLNVLSMARILSLMWTQTTDAFEKVEINRKLVTYLNQIDQNSKKMILNSFSTENVKTISLKSIGRRLQSGNVGITISESSKKILNLFSKQSIVSLELISHTLFNAEVSYAVINRLRVQISRLNLKLKPVTGLDKTFTFSDNGLHANVDIEIESQENPPKSKNEAS